MPQHEPTPMSDVNETVFHDAVMACIERAYGPRRVEHDAYFAESGRWADALVHHAPNHATAVEIESRFAGVFNAVGRTMLHAGHLPLGEALVVVPDGRTEEPERFCLEQQGANVFELGELATILLKDAAEYERATGHDHLANPDDGGEDFEDDTTPAEGG